MTTKVLVVEDNEEIYRDHLLRLFENLLSMEDFEFTNVGTIQNALDALAEEWDVILMDYSLGKQVQRDEMRFRNGADLVAFRRTLEDADPGPGAALIMGISGSAISNNLMVRAGANDAALKLNIESIADLLGNFNEIKKVV